MDTPSVTCRDAGLGNRMGEAQGILDQGGSSAILDEETSEEDPKGGEETSHAGFRGGQLCRRKSKWEGRAREGARRKRGGSSQCRGEQSVGGVGGVGKELRGLEGRVASGAICFVLYSRWDGRGPLESSQPRSDRSDLTCQRIAPAAVIMTDG